MKEDRIPTKPLKRTHGFIDDNLHLATENLAAGDHVKTFISAVEYARANGDEWVETTPDIIEHFYPQFNDPKKPRYFIYRGIKVCEMGQSEKLQEEITTPYYARLGMNEGMVEGGIK